MPFITFNHEKPNRFCTGSVWFSNNSRTASESTMRASARRLATVWKAEKMLSHIHRTGYGKRTWNLKFASPVKHWIWLTSSKETFRWKAVIIKAYKQHMKDWDFLMTLSHERSFLFINTVSLPRTMSSFPRTEPLSELHGHKSLYPVRQRSTVPIKSSCICPRRDRD